MARVLLVHWRETEALVRLAELLEMGHEAEWLGISGESSRFTTVKRYAPDVVVFDLSRSPKYSEYIALKARTGKSTSSIPFLFLDGSAEKVAEFRTLYPTERFSPWAKAEAELRRVKPAPKQPLPAPQPSQREPRRLWQKLNLQAGFRAYAADAPREFYMALTELPRDLEFTEDLRDVNIAFFFFDDWDLLNHELQQIKRQLRHCPVWIVYRKGALKSTAIRDRLIELGLIDYKICAVNANWAGMLIAHQRH